MRSIVIATANRGKFDEIRICLAGRFDRILSLADLEEKIEVVEDRATYLGNASKKARKIGNKFGINTLADDSGLEVDALDGRPGIFSARYAPDDKEKIDRLLYELEGVPLEKRTAAFKAYLAYYLPVGGQACIFYGELKGYIGFERRGKGGFGFDPIFMLPDFGKSLAELGTEEKNRISHRGKALSAFQRFLASYG
jgi:XTP/dITP diphosphohydrolase